MEQLTVSPGAKGQERNQPNETHMKLNLDLENKDGNAFSLIAYFIREAKRSGWTKEQIDAVIKDAQSGDYDHLVQVLMGV